MSEPAEITDLTAIVAPEEHDYYVQSLRPSELPEIGTDAWIKSHEITLKLLQQAHLEMRTHQEEVVTELIVAGDKLPVLVHEIFAVLLWRTRVLPKLLAIEPQPVATFALYTVLFHEATALSLIECVLFHPHGCEALNETCLDLIDYCAQALAQLIALACAQQEADDEEGEVIGGKLSTETAAQELDRQQRDLVFKIGMRCLSVLCYMCDKLDVLSLSAASRLVRTHDIPCVLSQVLQCAPWRRRRRGGVEKFVDDRWQPARGEASAQLTKVEAQTWLALRQLLFNATATRQYAITEFRQRELGKLQGLMNELLLDQLPPLGELKHHLCTLQVAGSGQRETAAQQVLLEEVPQVAERLAQRVTAVGGWRNVVQRQAAVFLHKSGEEVQQMASRLNEAYGADVWEKLEAGMAVVDEEEDEQEGDHECRTCSGRAQKKCFQCKRAYYCCRECQVKDWPRHKPDCRM